MVARIARKNWRTNISASLNLRLLIPKPRENEMTRIHWWSYGTLAESGNILASSLWALIEGPLPEGEGVSGFGFDQNALRDNDGLRVLHQASGASSTGTNSNAAGRPQVPHFVYPEGIWSVQDVWVGVVTDGGVDNMWCSLSYEFVKVSRTEYLHYSRSSPNVSDAGELNQ